MRSKEKQLDIAVSIAAGLLTDLGCCIHHPGYICDKDFPAACPACIRRWLLKKAREEVE